MEFEKTYRTRVKDSDFAGHQYFVNVYNLAHDLFEDFVIDTGIGWDNWFLCKDIGKPVLRSEAKYFAPIMPGKEILCLLSVSNLRESSCELTIQFRQADKKCALVKLVFVFITSKDRTKIPIPREIKNIFEGYTSS